jgi:hypothetical protein
MLFGRKMNTSHCSVVNLPVDRWSVVEVAVRSASVGRLQEARDVE